MKKTTLLSALLWGLISLTLFSCSEDDEKISFSQLPSQAQSFISVYFNGVNISRIEKENGGGEYKVYLSNGFNLEFYSNGEWKEVDGGNQVLPAQLLADLIPAEALAFVAYNYPNNAIVDIEKQVFGYGIEINTSPNTELHFDMNGNVIVVHD